VVIIVSTVIVRTTWMNWGKTHQGCPGYCGLLFFATFYAS